MKNPAPPSRAAFSLIELLVVIAILVGLLALVAPAFNSLGRASNLTNATGLISDELNFARQTALTRNRLVEVRFYLLRHEADSTTAYRAFRSFVADESGTQLSPLGPLKRLPTGITAISDDQFSTLLSDTMHPRKSDQVEDLPNATATPYQTIRFRSNGCADLNAYTSTNDTWFLTLKNENDRADSKRPAANFATIQLDPATGRTRQFRP